MKNLFLLYCQSEKFAEFIRFALVGVFATALHYFIYWIAVRYMDANLAYSLGYGLSFVFNFLLTSIFTFKVKASVKKSIGFGLSHFINYLTQLTLLNLFLYLEIPADWAPIPVFLIVIPMTFLLVRYVFKKK